MTEIKSVYKGGMTVKVPYEELFDKLTDIPFIASHYPDVAEIEPYQDGYLWKMNRVGAGKFSFQILYANHYPNNKEEKLLRWEPISGIGNADVRGNWEFDPMGDSTKLIFNTTLKIEVNIARLFAKPAEAVLNSETNKRMNRYLDCLKKTLEGGNGVINHF